MILPIEELNFIREADLQSLLWRKKLHLVLDLDHTLVHTKAQALFTSEDKQLLMNHKNKLHDICKGTSFVKLRPGVVTFLKELSTMFDMSIYTMGNNFYAKFMAGLLEGKSGNMFRFEQVLSRETCPTTKRVKTLDLVFSSESVVVIVDDTKDVWKNQTNLVEIAPYNFWSTGGSNSRPNLEGVEDEETMDVELARVLRTLKSVHGIFYGYDIASAEGGHHLDVRDVLDAVRLCEEYEPEDEQEEVITSTTKRKRSQEVLFDQSLNSCVPAKRYKTCNVAVDLPCSAC